MKRIEPTDQEEQLLWALREWRGEIDYRVVIEFRDGAWEIALSARLPGKPPRSARPAARGVGKTFDEAWDNVAPTWA
jgi:hypothetical protein